MESETFSVGIPVAFVCLLAVSLIAYQVWTIESLKRELEDVRKNFRDVANYYDQCRERVEEVELLLGTWQSRYSQKCERVEKLQSALKAIGEMAEESSHL